MEIFSFNTGNLRLDGGAMFGVVPKVLWNKVYEADENNYVTLSMRSLLIIDGDKKIIIDAGMGDKQDEKFFSHYFISEARTFDEILKERNLTVNDITDVVFTHLHFDHCGGAVQYNDERKAVLTFPNANYWVSKEQWYAAVYPNAREEASFLKENILPIEESGHLRFLANGYKLTENIEIRTFVGHTEGQAIPFITYKGQTIVYTGDLIPAVANIPLAWLTAYDMKPIEGLEEKEKFLNEAVENNYVLFFEHDIYQECCTLKSTPKGVRVDKTFSLEDWKKELN